MLFGLLLALPVVRAKNALPAEEPRWSPAAKQRFEDAKQLMQRGRYPEAAEAYRSVADWPDGGAFPERANALYLTGLMLERARSYERALEIYGEVARRFPGTEFARRASDAANSLAQGGAARGIEFRRRLDAAWDSLFPAQDLARRDGLAAAKPGLERAVTLLVGVLHDYRDHPRAKDIALTLGDAHMTLRRYEEARADYEQALDLARREAERPGDDARYAKMAMRTAATKRAEAGSALRRERIADIAEALLGTIGLGLILARPWRALDRRTLSLAAALLLGTGLLAGVAMGVARYVRLYVDESSPVGAAAAALLVLLPGVAGQVAALGFACGLRGAHEPAGRRWTVTAALLGAIAALAVATCLVHGFALFPFLDSKL